MNTKERAIDFLMSKQLYGRPYTQWSFPDGRELSLADLLTEFATEELTILEMADNILIDNAHEEINRLKNELRRLL